MNNILKQLIKSNLTNTNLNKIRGVRILAMTCFWSKCNFSAILTYYNTKYYCYYDNSINDLVIENY